MRALVCAEMPGACVFRGMTNPKRQNKGSHLQVQETCLKRNQIC